ncbi:hypothetical protein TCAL_10749 [Tigriopus californicus]|uniref:Netrin receptor UNC5 n=1 Tax=Tigriopus californicus TaxID=6832 RepID=A0A553NTH5_TIGCA|nr:netrin receptor UNC5B-like [Tigriopus californicus]TRY68737.1 hypothetical protein TCAL_10749 [Tigriopus californicus]
MTGEQSLPLVVFWINFWLCCGSPFQNEAGDFISPDILQSEPALSSTPTFLEQPQDSYVSRGVSANLTCQVAGATRVVFQCNGETMTRASETRLSNPSSPMKVTKVVITVKKSQVLDVLGLFSCQCHAYHEGGQVKSREALVHNAYLKRDFETPPYSQQIEVGRQAMLRCHPPRGEPEARVTHWLKNGQVVDPNQDSNFIQSPTGHLLIQQARMTDSANYTCAASNDVIERISPPAVIEVYARGQWGVWGEWSECNAKCGRGVRKRVRHCNNPAPVNGGPECEGAPIQKKTCNEVCPSVDGAWSDWSSWSSCSPDCLQFRRRDCNDPSPKHGGRYCLGKDIARKNCTDGEGICKSLNAIVLYGTEPPPRQKENLTSDLTLILGLVIALIVLFVVILIMCRLLKKKARSDDSAYGLNAGYSRNGRAGCPKKIHNHRPHEMPCDCTEQSYSERHSSEAGSHKDGSSTPLQSLISGPHIPVEIRPISEHYYEQPMVVFPPNQIKPSLEEHLPFLESPRWSPASSFNSQAEHLEDRVGGSYANQKYRTPARIQLPKCAEFRTTNWTLATPKGGKINIAKSDVCLTIPQGALTCVQEVFVSEISLDRHKPQLDGSQAAVTPVVLCGPVDITHSLQKPVVLSVPHSGGKGLEKLMVLYCANLDLEEVDWQPVPISNCDVSKPLDDFVYLQIDSTTIHLVTERLGAYVFVANLMDLNQIKGSEGSALHPRSGQSSIGYASMSSQAQSPRSPPPLLSLTTKKALCRCLDVPSCEGNGWQQLATALGADHYLPFLDSQASPSEALLNLWESRNCESDPLLSLARLLKDIKREDAIVILERDLRRDY